MRSLWQRPYLYVATFGQFKLEVHTDIKDATKERTYQPKDWEPVVNVGGHRLGFVGEALTFDAKDSYRMTFDGGGKRKRAQNHCQGYGQGDGMGLLSWIITGPIDRAVTQITSKTLNTNWDNTVTWTPTTYGLYELTVGQGHAEDALAKRWIRVYADRNTLDWKVTNIEGLTGAWGEGWSCNLTLQTEDTSLAATGIMDYQAVGVFCEDNWWNGAVWVNNPIGYSRQDPKCVMIGYVKEESIQKKTDAKTIQFTIESIVGQMDRSQSHKVAIWRGEGPPEDDGTDVDVPDRELQDCRANPHHARCRRRARHDKNKNNGVDTWGSILKGFGRVCVSDFALWFLQFKTNILLYHDFYAVWLDTMADLESIAGEETSVLSNLVTVGNNDYVVAGAMADGAIYFAPDRQVLIDNSLNGWETQWPTRMTLGDNEIWEIGLTKKKEKPVKFVKLIATKTADFQSNAKRHRKQRKQEKNNQIEAEWPDKDPPKYEPGTWYVRSDLLHDNERVIKDRAQAVYTQLNLLWSGVITTGLNRACHPGFIVAVNPTKNTDLWGSGAKNFIVSNYSAQIDVGERTWMTILELQEKV